MQTKVNISKKNQQVSPSKEQKSNYFNTQFIYANTNTIDLVSKRKTCKLLPQSVNCIKECSILAVESKSLNPNPSYKTDLVQMPKKYTSHLDEVSKILNQSSVLDGNVSECTVTLSEKSGSKQCTEDNKESEQNSVLSQTTEKQSISSVIIENKSKSNILESQDYSYKFHQTNKGNDLIQYTIKQIDCRQDKNILSNDEQLSRNQIISREFELLYDGNSILNQKDSSLLKDQSREIKKLKIQLSQYQKIISSKNLIIGEMEKELQK